MGTIISVTYPPKGFNHIEMDLEIEKKVSLSTFLQKIAKKEIGGQQPFSVVYLMCCLGPHMSSPLSESDKTSNIPIMDLLDSADPRVLSFYNKSNLYIKGIPVEFEELFKFVIHNPIQAELLSSSFDILD